MAHLHMKIASAAVALITVLSLGYIAIAQPQYLRESRGGVPFFTPPVQHPETGEALEIEVLIEHYKGS